MDKHVSRALLCTESERLKTVLTSHILCSIYQYPTIDNLKKIQNCRENEYVYNSIASHSRYNNIGIVQWAISIGLPQLIPQLLQYKDDGDIETMIDIKLSCPQEFKVKLLYEINKLKFQLCLFIF